MIDLYIIGLYLSLVLFAGLYNSSRATTLSGYGKLGNDLNNNIFILTATIFASAVGGGTTFGITEKTFSNNLSFSYALIMTIPIDILIARYLVPRLAEYREATSIGEIVRKHYGAPLQIITGFAAALISIGYLSAQISVSGIIFSFILKIDYIYGVLVSYLVVIIYASFGGFRSIVINNTIQFMAMILAIPVLSVVGIYHVGFDNFIYSIPQNKYDFTEFSEDMLYAFISFSVMGFYPTLVQRILAGRNSEQITKAIYLKTGIYFLFIISLSINGLLASIILPGSEAKYSLTMLINTIIPEGFRGLILIGFLASVMSTADSDLNVASISIVNDVIKPLSERWHAKLNSKKLILITKILSLMIGSSAILLVMKFKGVVDIVIFAAGLWAPIALVPLIGILYGIVLTDLGFFLSSLCGTLGFILFEHFYVDAKLSGVFVGTLSSALVFLSIANTRFLSKNHKN
ncbi:MAG: sodium:solute symporter family protein [Rickettsiaceae bacterium]|nr:sodium:solute symporter family protein [Rickettsiaceae bacterium]